MSIRRESVSHCGTTHSPHKGTSSIRDTSCVQDARHVWKGGYASTRADAPSSWSSAARTSISWPTKIGVSRSV